ncbi:MAG: AsnC family transcriptional regulator [Nitrososphaeraceae archaeon]|nr:AsnC family transcriptional regulator [Nitrososphaeraceae archaeon]
MHTELDEIDLGILNSLMKDGRKSFRQIAREIKVSTPTVETRFRKMRNDLGLIKNIQPIIDTEKLDNSKVLTSFIFMKVDAAKSVDVANKLSLIPEIKSIYMTTGEYNTIVKLIISQDESSSYSIHQLEDMVRNKIATIKGLNALTYQIVTKIIKDEQLTLSSLKAGALIKASCDYCRNEITKSAKRLQVGQYSRYFCCSSCLTLY